MKEPDEPMFTLTAQDRHGIYYHGRIRIPSLGLHHSIIGELGQAVHTADQIPLFRLVGIFGIIHKAL